MCIKIWTVNTNKLSLSANAYTATTAHTGSVDHDCIQRNRCLDVVLLCCCCTELHHDWRSDCDYFCRRNLALAKFIEYFSNEALASFRTVVCTDDDFITDSLHFVNENEEVLVAGTFNKDNLVSGCLEGLNDRVEWSCTETTANTNYRAVIFFNYRRSSKRTKYTTEVVTCLKLCKLHCRCPDWLESNCNPSFFCICICDCKRNAFIQILINHYNQKLSGLAVLCNIRSFKFHVVNSLRKVFHFNYFIHITPLHIPNSVCVCVELSNFTIYMSIFQ